MEYTSIYSLSDPKTGEIRYIGKTYNHLRKRLYAHINECKGDNKSHKISWIKSLLSNNEIPVISTIDIVPTNEWEFWEKYWIDQFRQWGFNLTNIAPGGYDNSYIRSEKTKKKMRYSKLGTKLPEEHKMKISEGVKKKFIDVPNYNKSSDKKHIIDKDFLYQKYIIDNLSIPKLSKILNVSEKTIFNNLKEYGIKKDKSIWLKQLSTSQKIVLQYDLDGNLIREWDSLKMIEIELSINKSNVANCCRNIAKSAGGFIWRYKDNLIKVYKLKRGREVEQYSKNNEFINMFNSLKEACLITGVRDNNIQDCCVGRLKSAGGFIWKYKSDI